LSMKLFSCFSASGDSVRASFTAAFMGFLLRDCGGREEG
jgi:hypothetical protein